MSDSKDNKMHELKTLPKYFQYVQNGSKNFELRTRDRNYEIGDKLILKEWDKDIGYTGKEIEKTITYIFFGGAYGLDPKYCILSFESIESTALEEHYKQLLSLTMEVKSQNTPEFMHYFRKEIRQHLDYLQITKITIKSK